MKNLENVQGDERDAILFSICYAPDANGKFIMNFGPLNRDGGERRLNVAITRAKEEVVVFSSIHGYQIDLERTGARGSAHLRYFLDYAERGLAVERAAVATEADGLCDTVASFLEKNGWHVERNIGCSGFRIDLGVRDPEHPDNHLLGIVCDGPAYASQKTARDRDHTSTSVLQSLGWRLYRLWSVEWLYDRARAEAELLAALDRAVKKQPEPVAAPLNRPAPAPVVATPAPALPSAPVAQASSSPLPPPNL